MLIRIPSEIISCLLITCQNKIIWKAAYLKVLYKVVDSVCSPPCRTSLAVMDWIYYYYNFI